MSKKKIKISEEKLKETIKVETMMMVRDLIGSGYVTDLYENEAQQFISLVISCMNQYELKE